MHLLTPSTMCLSTSVAWERSFLIWKLSQAFPTCSSMICLTTSRRNWSSLKIRYIFHKALIRSINCHFWIIDQWNGFITHYPRHLYKAFSSCVALNHLHIPEPFPPEFIWPHNASKHQRPCPLLPEDRSTVDKKYQWVKVPLSYFLMRASSRACAKIQMPKH